MIIGFIKRLIAAVFGFLLGFLLCYILFALKVFH